MSDDEWEANSIRLTLFPAAPLDLSGDYWRPIFGDEPEGEETRPRDGLKRQSGPWRGAVAEVQINPLRVDLSIGPLSANGLMGQPAIPSITIGPMFEWMDAFVAAVTPWLATIPFEINRAGLSGCAVSPGDSPLATYQILQRYVRSVDVKPGAMRDMFYRVNWPRHSEYLDYYNDLQTWASINYTVQAVNIGQSPFFQVRQEHYAQLQFDVNTPAERGHPLEHDTIVPIFQDLIDLARQGVTHGERPSDV